MHSTTGTTGTAGYQALTHLSAALDHLQGADLSPTDAQEAAHILQDLEACARRVRATQVQLLAEIHRGGVHHTDGHASAKVLVRHAANLSEAEAGRRAKAARALQDLPAVRAGFGAGAIGGCQVDRIARTHANRRVQAELIAMDDDLAIVAAELPYPDFDRLLTDWERLTDQDGAADQADRNHRNRDFRITRNLDGSRCIEGGCGSLQGQELADIFEHYVRAEFEADWAEARSRLGATATTSDLLRTDGQRRMDAAAAIFHDAAASRAAGPGGPHITTNLVMDQETFERQLRRLMGDDPGPDPRSQALLAQAASHLRHPAGSAGSAGSGTSAPPGGAGGFRCGTLDGHPIDVTEATAAALVGHVRRVVIGTNGVTLNMGRRTRLFSGPRQLAVQLPHTTCYWPGCQVPVSRCESDHLDPWHGPGGGRTDPDNGGPACGKHNRFRNHGFTVHRDPAGRWLVRRPDGSLIA